MFIGSAGSVHCTNEKEAMKKRKVDSAIANGIESVNRKLKGYL